MDHRQPEFELPPSKFIRINVLDLFRLDAEVFKGLPLSRVIKADHQLRQARSEDHSLDIAEGLPEGMSAEIAFQIDRGTPAFDKPIHRGDGQASSLAEE